MDDWSTLKRLDIKLHLLCKFVPKQRCGATIGMRDTGPNFSVQQPTLTYCLRNTGHQHHTRYCGSYECEPIVVTSCHGITRDQRPRCTLCWEARLGSAQCWVSSRCSELWPASSNFSHTFPSPLHFQTEFLVPRGFFRRSLLISPPLPVSRHIT